jgi:hypothetical protein
VNEPSPLPGADSPAARWFVAELVRTPRLAHHPTCSCYDHHLLRIGRLSLCLGCTCLTLGFLTATAVALNDLAFLQRVGPWRLIGLGMALYLPALVQPFWQRKAFKVVSRFLLGGAIACLAFASLFLLPWDPTGWLLRAIFVVVFALVWKATQRLRRRYTPNPCERCPHGSWPFCRGHHERVCALVAELRRRARPEDQPFVDLMAALAGLQSTPDRVELVTLPRR